MENTSDAPDDVFEQAELTRKLQEQLARLAPNR